MWDGSILKSSMMGTWLSEKSSPKSNLQPRLRRGFCLRGKIGVMNPKDQIKENLSITDVVATYVRLEKSGAQFRARCPFHNEKTPSFYVSPERKRWGLFVME